jgi:hypothetical protein
MQEDCDETRNEGAFIRADYFCVKCRSVGADFEIATGSA